MRIGILALQGAYAKHAEKVRDLGHRTLFVKTPSDLDACSHLIIPGGESTTLLRLLGRDPVLHDALQHYVRNRPVWGSCAGLILLATSVISPSQISLGVIDITVERNGYGRQLDSFFADDIEVVDESLQNVTGTRASGCFIRAPRITRCGDGVTVAMRYRGEVVAAYARNVCVSTFHPELTQSGYFHDWFIRTWAARDSPGC